MADRDQEILTAKQAKEFLQISDSTLRRYIRRGKLKAYRLAGERNLRFRRADLVALLVPANSGADSEDLDEA
ncbi:MAG: helix-turn-helix domain-containing protein [Armatimonadota bacterium]|nr:helix-turn-helix domain-containing protein [Armatimonadota bacterium]